jgi:nitrite reductase/ring-hydroxylating ferredoxin subunit
MSSRLLMLGGLIGGYGLFAWVGSRFLLPARGPRARQLFVSRVSDIGVGETVLYRTPEGHTVNITRRGSTGEVTDFIALSSTCPHLGCQVRWEPQNERYFCPCHNGTFDPSGVATGGPPGDAGQSLPRYPLVVGQGLLYIEVPAEHLTVGSAPGLVRLESPQGPGHDPCLSHLAPLAGSRDRGGDA